MEDVSPGQGRPGGAAAYNTHAPHPTVLGVQIELHADAAATIKQIDPTATVMLGGQAFEDLPGHPASEFLTQILADADYPAAANFDIAACHHYLPPNAAPQRFAEFKAALTRFGIGDRPVWTTEAGLPSWPTLLG